MRILWESLLFKQQNSKINVIFIERVWIMFDLIRNILALLSTFTVISTVVAMMFQLVVYSVNHGNLSDKEKDTAMICGVVIALVLVPFYYLPA